MCLTCNSCCCTSCTDEYLWQTYAHNKSKLQPVNPSICNKPCFGLTSPALCAAKEQNKHYYSHITLPHLLLQPFGYTLHKDWNQEGTTNLALPQVKTIHQYQHLQSSLIATWLLNLAKHKVYKRQLGILQMFMYWISFFPTTGNFVKFQLLPDNSSGPEK